MAAEMSNVYYTTQKMGLQSICMAAAFANAMMSRLQADLHLLVAAALYSALIVCSHGV